MSTWNPTIGNRKPVGTETCLIEVLPILSVTVKVAPVMFAASSSSAIARFQPAGTVFPAIGLGDGITAPSLTVWQLEFVWHFAASQYWITAPKKLSEIARTY